MPINAPTDIANLFAWYAADAGKYNNTVGGSLVTADAGLIGRWEDQSGNARHLTNGSAGTIPIFDAVKGLVVTESPARARFNCPASFTVDRRDFSAIAILELQSIRQAMNAGSVDEFQFFNGSTADALNLHFDGAVDGKLAAYDGSFRVTTSVPLTTKRCVIAWVGGAASLKCWVDGVSTTGTVLTAGSATLTTLLGAAGGSMQAGYSDVMVFTRAISDGEYGTVLDWARASRGVAASRSGVACFDGDSITHGYGQAVNRNWPSRVGLPNTVRHRVTAESGAQLVRLVSEAAARVDPLLVAGERNVVSIFAGTNDIEQIPATGTTVYNNLVTYCAARRLAGWKVVVYTMLPRGTFDATMETHRGTFNANVRANWATIADGMVDVAAVLTNSADTTYFNADAIHLNDAGAQVVADMAAPLLRTLGTSPKGGGGQARQLGHLRHLAHIFGGR